jgi:hypothetical protein
MKSVSPDTVGDEVANADLFVIKGKEDMGEKIHPPNLRRRTEETNLSFYICKNF